MGSSFFDDADLDSSLVDLGLATVMEISADDAPQTVEQPPAQATRESGGAMAGGAASVHRTLAEVQEAYMDMFGVMMTQDQLDRLFAVARKLGVPSSDGVWFILLALEHYHALYLKTPWSIVSAVRGILGEVRDEASASARESVADSRKEIVRIVRDAARGKTGWHLWRAHFAAIAGSVALFVLAFLLGQVFPRLTITTKIWSYIYG